MRRSVVAGGAVLLVALVGLAQPAAAGSRKTVVRAGVRGTVRSVERSLASILRADRLRDARLPVTRLARPRTVFRYVTPRRAQAELERGIRRGTHLTVRATPGRPLTAAQAARRYGLPPGRTVRETVHLARGTRVKVGKAIGGRPGEGELLTAEPLGRRVIRRLVRLREGSGH